MRYNQKIKHFPSHDHITTFNYPIFNPDKEETKTKERTKYTKDNNITRNDSVKRAKDKVFEIAISNQFKWFITLTFSPEVCNRESPKEISDKLKKWLSNQVQRNNLKYVIIPEYHLDGKAIHVHGLAIADFKLTDSGLKTDKGKTIFNINNWNFGWSTAIKITGDKVAVSRYITKYITKNTEKILGNIYYAGGRELDREVPYSFDYIHFYKVNAKAKEIPGTTLKVKYSIKEIKNDCNL